MSSSESIIDRLVDAFPRLFKGRPPRVPSDLPPGWAPIVQQMLGDIDRLLDDGAAARFEILQIKEKLAGLRVYWSLGGEKTLVADVHGAVHHRLEIEPEAPSTTFERVRDRVREAEGAAAQTCQHCGEAGRRRNLQVWLVIVCDSCAALTQATQEDAP